MATRLGAQPPRCEFRSRLEISEDDRGVDDGPHAFAAIGDEGTLERRAASAGSAA
jgi:hypothetical protein